ncbi:hypothetical protein G5574_01700 [Pantoea stewartii]|uniref:hypothetical protein n=1 Tax=Pantoea TaxID=53335 RepID=UPI000B190B77|nr:hypothetical protein [Pantoea stewartii]QIE95758.1 hypothetical protein G5574_01700 [Pantoea stewartii]
MIISKLQTLTEAGEQDGSVAATANETAAAESFLALHQGMRGVGKASILTHDTDLSAGR